ncbi:MAG: tetratricopeptide repeat protein, partial [Streptosporangiaceae bacterium]
MGLWPRLGVTALGAAAVAVASWQGLEATGAGQAAAAAVAAIAATVVVTLGAVWASRASDSADPAGALVSRSPSGQAIGHAQGPVFGPGSDFTGATIITGSSAFDHLARAGAEPAAPGTGLAGGPVVVGEIPQRPAAFQDRADLLAALTNPPAGGRVSVVFAVTGLRGVGKSQIAASCARQRLDEGWRVVAWLNAEDREQLLAGYAQLAAGLGLAGDAPDSEDAALRVRHWLEADGDRCLIVLDNAASAGVLRPFLPSAGHSQVIVTSSRASLAALGAPVPVDVFTPDQAAAYLAERTSLDDDAGARAVARELGCLPLALAHAGAVIAGQHLGYATYVRRLAEVTVAGYLTRPEEDPYPHGTAEAVTLSLRAAQAGDPGGLGQRLLAVIALLSPAGVSRSLVAGCAEAGPASADAALAHLAGWSLITWSVDGSAVSAHRLVMRVIREQAAADGSLAAAAGDAIRGLRAVLPDAEDAWRHPALMQEHVTQVTALADHLAAFPGLVAGQGEQDLTGLIGWAGWYLNEVSDITRAIPLLERAIADRERVLGPDHPDTLTSRNNLAGAYESAGRLGEAIPLYQAT